MAVGDLHHAGDGIVALRAPGISTAGRGSICGMVERFRLSIEGGQRGRRRIKRKRAVRPGGAVGGAQLRDVVD